jgi:hypothetical protein
MSHYERFRKDVHKSIEKVYDRHFGSTGRKGGR